MNTSLKGRYLRTTGSEIRSISAILVAALVGIHLPSAEAAAQTITAVPVFPGGGNSVVYAVNADGTAAAGYSNNAAETDTALRWTNAGGSFNMGFLPSGGINSFARTINASGTSLAGYGDHLGNSRAFRWTTGGGYQVLPLVAGTGSFATASGISASGDKVVGTSGLGSLARAFLWDSINPSISTNLGVLSGQTQSGAAAISGDGNLVVGASGTLPFRWTQAGGIQGLGAPLPGQVWALAEAVNTNGSVITGRYSTGSEWGYRWTAATGMVALPQTPNGASAIRPRAVSGDGNVIIGQVVDNVAGFTAFVWTPSLGTQLLTVHLASRGVNLAGWQITDATGISADGTAMCGIGIFGGQSVGWVVRGLPCPTYQGWALSGGSCPNEPWYLSVQASGPALTYRWFRNGVQIADGAQPSGSFISGSSNSLMTISNPQAADAGNYHAAIGSAGACEVLSVNLPLPAPPPLPTITLNPVPTQGCVGQSVVLTAGGTWSGGVTYVWERNNSPFPNVFNPMTDGPTGNGSTFSGAGTAMLTINNAQPGDSMRYRCRVYPAGCSFISSNVTASAMVTVTTNTTVTQNPQDTSVCPGDNDAQFFVAATPANVTLTYQWQKRQPPFPNVYNDIFDGPTGNGGNYGGTQTPTLTIAGVYAGDFERYRCRVSGPCGFGDVSASALLSPVAGPSITSGPTVTAACPGGNGSMAITAAPAGSTYQWQRYVGPCFLCWENVSNGPTGNGGTYAGAQSPTLTINTITVTDTFSSFRCLVTGPCGGSPADSLDAQFALLGNPVIQTQPVGGPVCKQGTKQLTVAVAPGNYGTITYQWWRFVPAFPIFASVSNGTLPSGAIASGATGPTLTLSNFQQQDAGQYYCMVSGACGNTPSNTVTLTWCPADFNCSGTVTVQDIYDFLAAWNSNSPSADFNGLDGITVQDIYDFLAAWNAGCP